MAGTSAVESRACQITANSKFLSTGMCQSAAAGQHRTSYARLFGAAPYEDRRPYIEFTISNSWNHLMVGQKKCAQYQSYRL